MPLNVLGPRVSFVVRVDREQHGQRVLVEQHPTHAPITLDVPAFDFDAAHWRV